MIRGASWALWMRSYSGLYGSFSSSPSQLPLCSTFAMGNLCKLLLNCVSPLFSFYHQNIQATFFLPCLENTYKLSSEWRYDVAKENCCTFFGSLCVAGLTRVLRLFEGWTFRRADKRKSSIIQTPSPDIWFGARVHTLAIIFPSNFPFL